ncbi:amidase domain-containing protein [Clostridium sporogenes]
MRKKFSMLCLLCLILISFSLFTKSKVFAYESTKSTNDLIKINKTIDRVLSSDYETLKTWKFTSCKDVIKDPKLLQLFDESSKFNVEWYKKGDIKINNYTSKVNIVDLIKESNDKYIANVTYDVSFKVIGNDFLSELTGERYRVELVNENNKWYVVKLLNLDTDLNTGNVDTPQNEINPITKSLDKDNKFPNYDKIINSKVSSINEVSSNIDEYAEKLKVDPSSDSNDKMMANSRSYSGYNSSRAVAYAHRWAKDRNLDYIDFGSDCTNFVSQCAYEGGGIPSRYLLPGWLPAFKKGPAYTKSWTCVKDFFNFMTKMGYASAPDGGCKKARLGDVLQFYNQSKKDWTHSVIVTKYDTKNYKMYCSAHTADHKDYPVWLIFGKTFGNIRLIKFWH